MTESDESSDIKELMNIIAYLLEQSDENATIATIAPNNHSTQKSTLYKYFECDNFCSPALLVLFLVPTHDVNSH